MQERAPNRNFSVDGIAVCPKCSNRLVAYDLPDGNYISCGQCGTYFHVLDSGLSEVLREFSLNDSYVPVLANGVKGEMDGEEWVVAGSMQKEEIDEGETIRWREYMLFNRKAGYATLVEFKGHWMMVRAANRKFHAHKVSQEVYTINYSGTHFDLYHSYSYKILFASGSFDENILDYERLHTWEYISPPRMLVHEVVDETSEWYIGTYKQTEEVAAAFGVHLSDMPVKFGVGLIEPSPFAPRRKLVYSVTIGLTALLLAVVLFLSFTRKTTELLIQDFATASDSSGIAGSCKPIVTSSFEVASRGGLEFTFDTRLNNDWMELSASLVNEQTGETYEFTKAIEYYNGVEGGESWSEGSNEESAFLSSVPPGRYHMNIYPFTSGYYPYDLRVHVTEKDWIGSNVLVMLLLILGLPVLNGVLEERFEEKRITYAT